MKKRMPRMAFPPAAMMVRLAMASWETIFHRTQAMARGTCSAAEYQKMVTEKMKASQQSAAALMRGFGGSAAMAPYLRAARANAQRLRRKK